MCASSGSACASGSLEPSHVLQAMGVPQAIAHGAVRLGLSRFTTDEEIDRVLGLLPGVIDRLSAISPMPQVRAAGGAVPQASSLHRPQP